ncbi:PrgI family protein [Candidatus Saccharibacteria bacterium]|nr:PrgI family protein [Candidatus Saccharibacteria bacterium]
MAVYKVIQDVEAEDKLLGPLSFKGFIYAIIAAVCAFINFKLLFIGTPIKWLIMLMFLMPMILFGVLASPLGREQPTEVWLLSKIRFFLKPRRRIWDQEGMEELVTITAPMKIEQRLTKDISQSEVRSRLKTLASTLDTRGWAIKNVDSNLNLTMPVTPAAAQASDRLVPNAGYTQPAPVVDIHAADDILDEQNNPTAQKFASLMQDADEKRKKSVLETMKGLIKDGSAELPKTDLTKKLVQARASFHPKHAHKPVHKTKQAEAPVVKSKTVKKVEAVPKPTPVTPERQAVNMELAQSGSAFSVATLSQLANRQPTIEQTGPNEVTISLH